MLRKKLKFAKVKNSSAIIDKSASELMEITKNTLMIFLSSGHVILSSSEEQKTTLVVTAAAHGPYPNPEGGTYPGFGYPLQNRPPELWL